MHNGDDWLLKVDVPSLDTDKLRRVAEDLQTSLIVKTSENQELRDELKKAKEETRFPLPRISEVEDFGSWSTSKWIRAEQDYPGDVISSWSCLHGEKPPTVILFDPNHNTLEATSVNTLINRRAVFSRLPSHRSTTVYVHIQSITNPTQTSKPRFMVTTKSHPPPEMMYHCTIHLKKLPWAIKMHILLSRIKWLFILRSPESRKSTGSSGGLKSPPLSPRLT